MHFQARRASLAASCALILSVSTGAYATDRPTAAAPVQAASAIHIYNFGRIGPTYYRGSELKGNDAVDLSAAGVKTVIDLRNDGDYDPAEAQQVAAAGMRYVRIPMTTHDAPTAAQIAAFLSLVRDSAAQPVYVHCVEGRHRTGVMTAIYRMTVDGWTADQAFREMKQFKFGADFLHPQFKKFVFAFNPAQSPAASVPAHATN